VTRAAAAPNAPMVIAATPVTPAAFCVADDSRVIRPPPRAAAGFQLRSFYCWPGRELGHGFSRLI